MILKLQRLVNIYSHPNQIPGYAPVSHCARAHNCFLSAKVVLELFLDSSYDFFWKLGPGFAAD